MIGLHDIKAVYFIGIGGIGMSALARFFNSKGVVVSGYDKTQTDLTRNLEAEGMKVYYDEDVVRAPKDVNLVVYTPAIPTDHKELNYYRAQGYQVVKRSEVLQIITASSLNVCVAGTHGKTTISTMTAFLLQESGHGCNAFLGGLSVNYGTNFWSSINPLCVVEADEYDRSFHKLSPDYAVVSSMDPDHLDIYGTPENVEEAFIEFTRKIRSGGWLLHKYGLKRAAALKADHIMSYHVTDEGADIHVRNLNIVNGGYQYDVVIRKTEGSHVISGLELHVGGLHNVENSLPAIALCHLMQLSDEKIRKALAAFRGVKRRFEYWIEPGQDIVMVDDYAHHPEELSALISGARSLFKGYGLMLIFQPHLYSRTRDLADGFAASLDRVDMSILLPIYPARELPMAGVSSGMIADKMQLKNVMLMEKEAVPGSIMNIIHDNQKTKNIKRWVVITAGAGDIDVLLPALKEKILNG
ncbi:MAG: UDP-N-acetylmuramate--L-alanine ligase [Bacteroidota bacterium]